MRRKTASYLALRLVTKKRNDVVVIVVVVVVVRACRQAGRQAVPNVARGW